MLIPQLKVGHISLETLVSLARRFEPESSSHSAILPHSSNILQNIPHGLDLNAVQEFHHNVVLVHVVVGAVVASVVVVGGTVVAVVVHVIVDDGDSATECHREAFSWNPMQRYRSNKIGSRFKIGPKKPVDLRLGVKLINLTTSKQPVYCTSVRFQYRLRLRLSRR